MLPLNYNLSDTVAMKISKNVYYMIELFISSCEGLDWESFLVDIFPEFYFRKNPERCKTIVIELFEISKDGYKREYIKPIYEYALYYLIKWWLDVTDIELDEQIAQDEIVTEDDKFWAKHLNDIENYPGYIFEDIDFLDVPEIYEAYKLSPRYVNEFLHVDLNEYIELMPDDIREEFLYLERAGQNTSYLEDDKIETYVIRSVYSLLKHEENRPIDIDKCSEVELSNRIQGALHALFYEKGIHFEREELAGYANKTTGELDFYGYRFADGIYEKLFVGENKEWGKFENSLKQLIGYMDQDYNFGFTIIFNKKTRLETVLNSRKNILIGFHIDDAFKMVGEIEEVSKMKDVLRTKYENPEKSGTYFNVYHFIINTYKPERKAAAKDARKK